MIPEQLNTNQAYEDLRDLIFKTFKNNFELGVDGLVWSVIPDGTSIGINSMKLVRDKTVIAHWSYCFVEQTKSDLTTREAAELGAVFVVPNFLTVFYLLRDFCDLWQLTRVHHDFKVIYFIREDMYDSVNSLSMTGSLGGIL